MKRSFDVLAGDVLTFRWAFATSESPFDAMFDDLAFVTLSSGGTQLLADTFAPLLRFDAGPFYGLHTDFQLFSYTVPVSGTLTLGLGVLDVSDPGVTSALFLDAVIVSSAFTGEPPVCSRDVSGAEASFYQAAPGEFVVPAGATFSATFIAEDLDGDVLTASVEGLP